eukprot:420873-Karenia_brevis.AAC.1
MMTTTTMMTMMITTTTTITATMTTNNGNQKTARHLAPQIPYPSGEHTCGRSTPNPTPADQK